MYILYIFHEYTQQKMGWVLINKYDLSNNYFFPLRILLQSNSIFVF